MDLVFYDLVYIGITEILDKCNKEIKLHVSFVNRDEYNFQKRLMDHIIHRISSSLQQTYTCTILACMSKAIINLY